MCSFRKNGIVDAKIYKLKSKDCIWYPFAEMPQKHYVFTCDYTIKRLSFIIVLFENIILSFCECYTLEMKLTHSSY